MLRKVSYIILLFILIGGKTEVSAQTKAINFDYSFQYDLSRGLHGKIMVVDQDSSVLIYLKIASPLDSLLKYKISYSLLGSLDEEVNSVIQINSLRSFYQFEDRSGSQFGLKSAITDAKYFVMWLTDTSSLVTYPYVKRLARTPEQENILLEHESINAAIFDTYMPINSIIRAKATENSAPIKVDFYDYHFLPAKPPMTVASDSVRAPFVVDSSTTIASGSSINLDTKGLYYIHLEDRKVGRTILVRDRKYPKFSSIDRLVEGLRYLATEDEYQKMNSSFKKKELFDEFWLNNTKSESKAKRAIREYFKRVREANTLFTTYKEGWKTDMGMIYIIFGPPSKVFIKEEGVMWIYNKTFELPRIAFQFNHVNTAFTEDHYVLERNSEFQNLWFRTIDLWRTGKKEF